MIELYQQGDKIMLKDTGQVLTVHEDLSRHLEPGIIVKEKIGRLLMHCEVRPAGHTRQRREAEAEVAPAVPANPPSKNRVIVETSEDSSELPEA